MPINNRYRRFLAELQHFNSPQITMQQIPHLLTTHEIENEPIKWLKRLILVRTGLSSMDFLNAEIKRFNMREFSEAKLECKRLAMSARNDKFMIVVKAIPFNSSGQIPNFRIYSTREIDETFSRLQNLYASTNRQLWFCLSDVDESGLNIGGRILISQDQAVDTLEMVWFTSPRMIEEFSVYKSEFPFWRGYRMWGKLFFDEDILFIPKKFRDLPTEIRLKEDVAWVSKSLSQHKNSIEYLCSSLFSKGIRNISLEFRVSNGNFGFIDWDTDRDLIY